jgi:hypothetical protein
VAASLSTADPSMPEEALAWLAVPGASTGTDPASGDVARAFASVTAAGGEVASVTPTDAALAGDVMVAQLEESPAGNGGAELASTEGVRPRIGDGSDANETPEPAGQGGDEPFGEPRGTKFASFQESSAPAPTSTETTPGAEPDESVAPVLPSPAYDEERVPPLELASTKARAVTVSPSDTGVEGESSEPTISMPETEPPEAITGTGVPVNNPGPVEEPPEAGPTAVEDDGVALAPAPNEEDEAEGGPNETPTSPSDEAFAEDEGPEITPTEATPAETSPRVSEHRVEVVTIDEDASDADAGTSDEPPSEPETREAPRAGGREAAGGEGLRPEGGIETLLGEDRGSPREERRPPVDDRVEFPEDAEIDEGDRMPERPVGERRVEERHVERRGVGDRRERVREVDPPDRVERIRISDGGGEVVQEEVDDLTVTHEEAVVNEGEQEPAPANEPAPDTETKPCRVSDKGELERKRRPVENRAVGRRISVAGQQSPDRESARARPAVESASRVEGPSEADRKTDRTQQGGKR